MTSDIISKVPIESLSDGASIMVTFIAGLTVAVFLSMWILALVVKVKEDPKPKKRRRRR
jgi:hypothetical protein